MAAVGAAVGADRGGDVTTMPMVMETDILTGRPESESEDTPLWILEAS